MNGPKRSRADRYPFRCWPARGVNRYKPKASDLGKLISTHTHLTKKAGVIFTADQCHKQCDAEWTCALAVFRPWMCQLYTGREGGFSSFRYPGVSGVFKAGSATQSSEAYGGAASRGIDGNRDGVYNNGACTHTRNEGTHWWQVEFIEEQTVEAVIISARQETYESSQVKGVTIKVGSSVCATGVSVSPGKTETVKCASPIKGKGE